MTVSKVSHYRKDIDGLRAISVLFVMAYHSQVSWAGGGFLGVDVFFVISGFLITGKIYESLEVDRFRLSAFYLSRIRRLLPAQIFVSLLAIFGSLFFIPPPELADAILNVSFSFLWLANVYTWMESSYFGLDSFASPFIHYWSLSLEEQYYALYPVFLIYTWRALGSRLFYVLIAAAILSLSVAIWGAANAPSANFLLLPSRVWELLCGGITWRLMLGRDPPKQRWLANACYAAGLLVLGSCFFLFTEKLAHPGAVTLAPIMASCVLLYFGPFSSLATLFVANRVLVKIGLISYSLYLWHQPIYVAGRYCSTNSLSGYGYVALSTVALGFAYLTWRFIEQPFRTASTEDIGIYLREKIVILIPALSCVVLFVVVAVVFYEQKFSMPRYRSIFHSVDMTNAPRGDCQLWVGSYSDLNDSQLRACAAKYGSATVVVGDSHAADLVQSMLRSRAPDFIIGVTGSGCRLGMTRGGCDYAGLKDFLISIVSLVDQVIYAQAGFYLLNDDEGGAVSRDMFSATMQSSFVPSEGAVESVSDFLSGFADLAKVTWLGPWLEPQLPFIEIYKRALACDGSPPLALNDVHVESFLILDDYIQNYVESQGHHNIRYVSTIPLFAMEPDYLYNCNAVFWRDGDHLSRAGQRRLGHYVWDAFLGDY